MYYQKSGKALGMEAGAHVDILVERSGLRLSQEAYPLGQHSHHNTQQPTLSRLPRLV
jgi:hypothetical protein